MPMWECVLGASISFVGHKTSGAYRRAAGHRSKEKTAWVSKHILIDAAIKRRKAAVRNCRHEWNGTVPPKSISPERTMPNCCSNANGSVSLFPRLSMNWQRLCQRSRAARCSACAPRTGRYGEQTEPAGALRPYPRPQYIADENRRLFREISDLIRE